jgi:hypothetical protein
MEERRLTSFLFLFVVHSFDSLLFMDCNEKGVDLHSRVAVSNLALGFGIGVAR